MANKYDEKNFNQEVLNSSEPVLVDFYADWCGPCRMMGPVVESLADTYAGKAKVGKVNVDESQALAASYGVMTIPTFMLFRDGKVVDSVTGGVPPHVLKQMVDKVV